MRSEIEMNKRYFWNFRDAVNVCVMTVKRDAHRREFVYCTDENGKELCVEDVDLSEEPK